jgi:hypothetical protein
MILLDPLHKGTIQNIDMDLPVKVFDFLKSLNALQEAHACREAEEECSVANDLSGDQRRSPAVYDDQVTIEC